MIYEPETIRVMNAVLEEGDSVLIAGAHRGYFAEHCLNLGCKVYAFEPEATNFSILKSKVEGRNVELFNVALGDRKASAILYVNTDNDGGHALWDISLNKDNIKSKEDHILQNTIVETIDSLFPSGIDRLKLILLDAEGSELSILKGAINTIVDSDIEYIICEINEFALRNANASQKTLRSYLSMYGFQSYIMKEDEVAKAGDTNVVAKVNDKNVVFNMLFSRAGAI